MSLIPSLRLTPSQFFILSSARKLDALPSLYVAVSLPMFVLWRTDVTQWVRSKPGQDLVSSQEVLHHGSTGAR